MTTLILGGKILALFMSSLFLIALVKKNNGTADIGYGLAFLVLIGTIVLTSPSLPIYVYVLVLCSFVWGIRLAIRIYLKNADKPEDFRYRAWREAWGKTFVIRSFFQIYILQGSIIFLVALPVTLSIVSYHTSPIQSLICLGVLLWIIGFYFEARGDYELDQFIKDEKNRGKIMMSGLWKYTRHPNYFGESLMWWGLSVAGFGITSNPLVFTSPLLITFLLLKISGVPMLEKRWEGNSEWESYKAKTSVFIPRLPKL